MSVCQCHEERQRTYSTSFNNTNLPFIIVPPTSIPQPFLKTTGWKPKAEETINPLSESRTPHCGTHLSFLYAPPMNSSRPHEKTQTELPNAYGNKIHIVLSSLNVRGLQACPEEQQLRFVSTVDINEDVQLDAIPTEEFREECSETRDVTRRNCPSSLPQ